MYSSEGNFSTRCQSRFLPGQGIQKIQRETYRESIRIRKRANEALKGWRRRERNGLFTHCVLFCTVMQRPPPENGIVMTAYHVLHTRHWRIQQSRSPENTWN